jgi:3-hydroxyisobutyrate dehydrogenase-like beta-hydroxyacid dehydrogenase
MNPTVGFIGLGQMGQPMALNLLRAGFGLRVYDVQPSRAAQLVEQGASLVASPAETVVPGGIVVSMVPDDRALAAIVEGPDGIIQRLGPGGVHCSMSTVSPALSEQLAAWYAQHDCSYVAATVSGRPDVAAAGQLSIYIAGQARARERLLPLLRVLGAPGRLYEIGDTPQAAAAVKIAMNLPIPLAILAMAEAASLAEKYGVPRARFLGMLSGSPLFAGRVYEGYGEMVAQDWYQPALFPAALGRKDLTLMLDAAAQARLDLPEIARYRDLLRLAEEHGWGEEDWSVAARVLFEGAGLPVNQVIPT